MTPQPAAAGRITLLTDFGTADGYVAAMRGVIAQRAPHVRVDDAAHDIAPGDVLGARFALERYWQFHPRGTVHVVVVDPGVGGARRALAVRALDRFGVGPDNGVLEPLLEHATAVHAVENDALFLQPVSRTFHGRDVFAPVAAYLAAGGLLDEVGPRIADPVRLRIEPPVEGDDGLHGRIVHVDRFGNLITNIRCTPDMLNGREISIEGAGTARIVGTYAEGRPGELLALIGSSGYLEIALRDANAASMLGAGRGLAVLLRPARMSSR